MPKTAAQVKEIFSQLNENVNDFNFRLAINILIVHCDKYEIKDNGEYLLNDENKIIDDEEKKKKKAEIAAIYLERLKLMNDIAAAANKYPDEPNAGKIKDKVKELSEEYLKELTDFENEKENEAISQDYTNYSNYEKKAYAIIKKETEMKAGGQYSQHEGLSDEEFFKQQKDLLANMAAKSIAVHTLGRTYRSMLHADESMTENEKDNLAKEFFGTDGKKVFNTKGIEQQYDEIKNSKNFQHMMSKITDWNKFLDFKEEIGYSNNYIIDRLSKATKEVLDAEKLAQRDSSVKNENTLKLNINN